MNEDEAYVSESAAPRQPVYTVGNARLWIGEESFEPGSVMTALEKIEPGLLEYYIRCGHLTPEVSQ